MSDQEWEIRTGRAIYVLQQTLPDFFEIGLVAAVDRSQGPAMNDGNILKRGGKIPGRDDVEEIYSPKVILSYTPPTALPPPFPRTWHLEGLPLYMASSVFLRHTMKALYTDLSVELRKVTVQSSASRSNDSPSFGQVSPGSESANPRDSLHRRQKSMFVRLGVSGINRVSGATGEWDIASTYTFSPTSGLVSTHTINSIHPAPHLSAYDMLRAALGKLGLGGSDSAPKPGVGAGAACEGSQPRTSSLSERKRS
ncbi:hypothetical protein GLOTRDRAFT_48713 [Gloeophyllum trabeum ATCC 11539]|uniref:Uncharacterized protein n=1 Tax=Gloeophyllum trabeum (strain ATCC 11539 / FP-39264 / Madison 617) TaxID=670483 RepID=S7PVI2_GLOTA|nr:uncharacterized protein GLOTRDRAFT_48713 [Gloeophyllum trabeum ATCC 11539]EPQ51498.1 hypothetical protein GLOTRDRAFT_48713 [Gloeophyllum trabeum ATCC 11539]